MKQPDTLPVNLALAPLRRYTDAMSKRLGLTLSDDLHAWLVDEARRNRRSLQAQILWMLEQASTDRERRL